MEEKNQGKRILSGLIWTFGERITAQLVSTLVTIMLARLLEPDHYGIISLVTIYISFCNVFVTSGFGSAIVRKHDAKEEDYNTACAVSSIIAILLYIVLFLLAPLISDFYNMPQLIAVTRVMALRLPIAALNSIQQAHIQREMEFKRFFITTIFGTVVSGIVGICMALRGFGVWALVAQYLTNTTVDTIVLWFVGGWTPGKKVSVQSAKEIFNFGWKILASEIVATFQNDIKSLAIGKAFGSADLAFYDQGKKYPSILVININTAINKVMLPAYSKIQDNVDDLKTMLRRSTQMGLFIIMPLMIGFATVAKTFVSVVLTDKWLECVPYLQIFCIYYFTRPLEASCQQAILAIGRSDIIFKIMLFVNIPSFSLLFVTVLILHDIYLLALSSLITTIISFVSYMVYANLLIGYTVNEQLSDIIPIVIATGIMGIGVVALRKVGIEKEILLIGQVVVGGLVYILCAKIFKIPAFEYCISKIKTVLR